MFRRLFRLSLLPLLLTLLAAYNLAAVEQQPPDMGEKKAESSGKTEQAQKTVNELRQELVAARAERDSYLDLYRVALVQREWQARNVARANELLNECPPQLRSWEWDYLKRQVNGGLLTLAGSSCIAFSPDGKHLALAGDDNTVRICAATTGKDVLVLKGHQDSAYRVVYSPDGRQLASTSADKTVKVWDVANGKELVTLPCSCHQVAFSPDGKRIAFAGTDGTAKVWDAATGKEVLTLKAHDRQVLTVAFSPDGQHLATGGGQWVYKPGVLQVWDLTTGKEVLSLKGHTEGVRTVAFSPDGKRIASGSMDTTVRVWDAASGLPILTLIGHADGVNGVQFSSDGRRLVSTAGGWRTHVPLEAKIWDATPLDEQRDQPPVVPKK